MLSLNCIIWYQIEPYIKPLCAQGKHFKRPSSTHPYEWDNWEVNWVPPIRKYMSQSIKCIGTIKKMYTIITTKFYVHLARLTYRKM